MSYNPQKKLFKIERPKGPVFFSSKPAAKRKRNALNAEEKAASQGRREGSTVVMRGPDHWRGESFNRSHRTPKTSRKRKVYRRAA